MQNSVLNPAFVWPLGDCFVRGNSATTSLYELESKPNVPPMFYYRIRRSPNGCKKGSPSNPVVDQALSPTDEFINLIMIALP